MDDFRMGAHYVLERLARRMYYIPDKWKEKDDAGAIYNIIKNTMKDIRKELDIEEVKDGEQVTTGKGV